MKNTSIKSICLLGLLISSLSITQAQNYRNALLGRYIITKGTIYQYNQHSGTTIDTSYCMQQEPGTLIFTVNNYCNNCMSAADSSDCNNPPTWLKYYWDIEVFADSTFKETTSNGVSNGRLFKDDSLVVRFKKNTVPIYVAYRGYKLYSMVGVNELLLHENALLLSPNPSDDFVYIQSTQQSFANNAIFMLYDLLGNKLANPFNYVNSHTYKLNTSNLPTGIYLVALSTPNGLLKKKLVVNR